MLLHHYKSWYQTIYIAHYYTIQEPLSFLLKTCNTAQKNIIAIYKRHHYEYLNDVLPLVRDFISGLEYMTRDVRAVHRVYRLV